MVLLWRFVKTYGRSYFESAKGILMEKNLIIFLAMNCIFFSVALSQPGDRPKFTVLPFQTQGDVPTTLGETVSDLLTNRINPEKFFIVERASLEKSFQTKLVTESLTQENANALQRLGISMIMLGQISKIDGKYYGGYRIVEVASARIGLNDSIKANTFDEFMEALYFSLVAKGFMQDKDYVVVKRDQWEMLNKYVKQSKTPTPLLLKQYEYCIKSWAQNIEQKKSYTPTIREITSLIREIADTQETEAQAEQQALQRCQKELTELLDRITEIQARDRQQYDKLVMLVNQNDFHQTVQFANQYLNEKTHFRIMSDAIIKLTFNATIMIYATPSQGFNDSGAGPDPTLKLNLFAFQNWFNRKEWEWKGSYIFQKDDIVGEVEIGNFTASFDLWHGYALNMQLLERNLFKTEEFPIEDIDISGVFQVGQTSYFTKTCGTFGSISFKFQSTRIAFNIKLPKFKE